MDATTEQVLVDVLRDAPRLSFRRTLMDVFNEVPGIVTVWRRDELLHVAATDDIGFDLFMIRHGMHQRCEFVDRLFSEVVAAASFEVPGGQETLTAAHATRLLVHDQLTYSVQPLGVTPATVQATTAVLRDLLPVAELGTVGWRDGWQVPLEVTV